MKANERIDCISERIKNSDIPVSGSTLAKEFDVSRQIIVKDIAELKRQGVDVIATARGYIINKPSMPERVFKVVHSDDDTEKELREIVHVGGIIVNVFVWHKIYGKIEAPLNIKTSADVDEYIINLKTGRSGPLKNVTNEYHNHLVKGADESVLDNVEKVLGNLGYLVLGE